MLSKTIPDTRQVRRDATRKRIVQAAWRLARRDGLAGITLRDLGAAVGMRGPAIYTYFSSKNEIYDAMYLHALRELARALEQCPTDDDPVLNFRLQARRFVRFNLENPLQYQLIFQRPVPSFVPSPEAFAFGAAGLARAQERVRAVGADDDRALDLWRAVVNGLISQQIANDPDGDRWMRLLDEAIDMFVAHNSARKTGRSAPTRIKQPKRTKGERA